MKRSFKVFLLSLFLVLFASQVSAQTYSLPGDGNDFWLGFVNPSYNKVASAATVAFYGAYALVSSYTDNHITVSYFDKQSGVEMPGQRFFIPERTGIQVPLDLTKMTPNDTGDIAEFCACHIIADRPINVEFFSSGACGGGSYLPITSAGLGHKYVIASYQNNPGELGIMCGTNGPSVIEVSHGFFEIIAPDDNTTVTITPNSTTLRGHTGFSTGNGSDHKEHPYSVTLRRGQCYLVKSGSMDDQDDISNSIVESNKPISVIAGHENAAIGGVSQRVLEGRNYMVQQMYPSEMWDTTGYLMIPLKDSQPADASAYDRVGEKYRMFTSEPPGAQCHYFDACIGQPFQLSAGRLQSPPTERMGVTCPVDFEGTNGVPFTVMMYDQRNIANNAPFPAPSMITVIPMSHWRTSYLWYVPANKFESLQGYYVNVIAPDADFTGLTGIQASFNGGPIKPIKQVLSLEQQWKTLPNHPELTGVRFKLYPGSYYATGPHPFMVYNFGFRGLNPENALGGFSCDDYYFSYGLPAGVKLGTGTVHIRTTVDTLCSYWNICAHDSTFGLGGGIKSITLFDDPQGDFVKPGRAYYNTRLDDSLDPGNTREINFTGNDSDLCFKVLVNKPIDSAYAPIFIADDQGNAIILDLHYTPPMVKLTPDSGRYLLTGLGKDTCTRFVFYNLGPQGSKSFTFISDKLKLNNPNFKITSTFPSLPAMIKPGDSLIITTCFNAKDTMQQRDTIMLINDCWEMPIDLQGSGSTPIIVADDHDFGAVIVDSTKCAPVGVKNIGNAPLILTRQWLMNNYGVNFTFPDSALLPMQLKPGQKITLTFCYTPHAQQRDSAVQHWGTNLAPPYLHSNKDSSILIGMGVKAGFVWDRTLQVFLADSTIQNDSVIIRVHLYNNSADRVNGPTVHVDKVFITGPDAAEFYILNDQLGKLPMGNFDLAPTDSVWVDVVFKPDVTKGFRDRHADLGPRQFSPVKKIRLSA
ncbi:MAG: IgGFc-binding protein [Candidatus Kapaibacterium sp.]